MSECVFCKIVDGDLPSTKVFENESVIAFESIEPVAEAHTLIVPKKHIGSFMDLDDKDIIFEMTKAAQEVVHSKNIQGGYKTIVNGGKYQAIPHVHWHVIGGKLEDKSDVLNNT